MFIELPNFQDDNENPCDICCTPFSSSSGFQSPCTCKRSCCTACAIRFYNKEVKIMCIFGCPLQKDSKVAKQLFDTLRSNEIIRGKTLNRYKILLGEMRQDPCFYRCSKCRAGNLRQKISHSAVCFECGFCECVKCGAEVIQIFIKKQTQYFFFII